MDMPKLSPIALTTKGKSFFEKIKVWVTEVRKWEVVEDWEYKLPNTQKIIIPKGFVFDGASIPRPLWGILSPTGLLLIQGLIHDFGYRYDYLWGKGSDGNIDKIYENSGQEFWDKLFYEVGLKVNDMSIINKLAWFALSLMGKKAWHSNQNKHEVDIYPNMENVPK